LRILTGLSIYDISLDVFNICKQYFVCKNHKYFIWMCRCGYKHLRSALRKNIDLVLGQRI